MNCGLKAYRNEVVKNIEVYGEMHRYIPYLAKNAGFSRITEKPVQHQKRKYGVSKFGLERFVNGLLDLISLWFLSRFGKKPMHFFGFTGILMFLAGGFAAIWVIVEKLVQQANGLVYRRRAPGLPALPRRLHLRNGITQQLREEQLQDSGRILKL